MEGNGGDVERPVHLPPLPVHRNVNRARADGSWALCGELFLICSDRPTAVDEWIPHI